MEVKLNKVILCEGKHDAWFVDEAIKKNNGISKVTRDFRDFQEKVRTLLRDKPIGDPNPSILILYLDANYKDEIYKRVSRMLSNFQRIVEKFRKCEIILIIDKNGEDDEYIKAKFMNELENIINRFRPKPTLEESSDTIIVKFESCTIPFKLFIVPNSLEIEIFKKLKNHRKYRRTIRRITAPKEAIFKVCKSYFECNSEQLFREVVKFFNNDKWFTDLLKLILEV